jgi:chorismate mutase
MQLYLLNHCIELRGREASVPIDQPARVQNVLHRIRDLQNNLHELGFEEVTK